MLGRSVNGGCPTIGGKPSEKALNDLKEALGAISPKQQRNKKSAEGSEADLAGQGNVKQNGIDLGAVLGGDMKMVEEIVKNPITRKIVRMFVGACGVDLGKDSNDTYEERAEAVKNLKEDVLQEIDNAVEDLKGKVEDIFAKFEDNL